MMKNEQGQSSSTEEGSQAFRVVMRRSYENVCAGTNNVVIGQGNICRHDGCIVIGSGLATSHNHQLLIGNVECSRHKKMTTEEYHELRRALGV